jgi:hypothetical protein
VSHFQGFASSFDLSFYSSVVKDPSARPSAREVLMFPEVAVAKLEAELKEEKQKTTKQASELTELQKEQIELKSVIASQVTEIAILKAEVGTLKEQLPWKVEEDCKVQQRKEDLLRWAKQRESGDPVTFSYVFRYPHSAEVTSVALLSERASFGKTQLVLNKYTQQWTATMVLPAGKYEFYFLVNEKMKRTSVLHACEKSQGILGTPRNWCAVDCEFTAVDAYQLRGSTFTRITDGSLESIIFLPPLSSVSHFSPFCRPSRLIPVLLR